MYSRNALKEARLSIIMTIVAAAISSFSLNLIPLLEGFEEGKNTIIAYAIAAVFWVGLLLTFISMHLTKKALVRSFEKLVAKGQIKKNHPIGLVSFSKDWKMWFLYGITFLGVVMIVTDIVLSYVPEIIMFPIISITILSFAIHCVIDGKYYKTYKLMKESINNETNL